MLADGKSNSFLMHWIGIWNGLLTFLVEVFEPVQLVNYDQRKEELKYWYPMALCRAYVGCRGWTPLEAVHHNLLETSNLTHLWVRYLFNVDDWRCHIRRIDSPIYTWCWPITVRNSSLIQSNALSSKFSVSAFSTLGHIFCKLFS